MIDTLFELLRDYTVVIPIVQRDYALGRANDHAQQVRIGLLGDMKEAINGGDVLDLNFIYGKTNDREFIPLDGQQRLTTLFLVHLFAFANDDSKTELLQKFTYETRTSSRKFLEKLVEQRAEVFAGGHPTAIIDDAEWYQVNWDNDPTVLSVKTVLDDIVNIFETNEGLGEKLSDTGKEPIKFCFLPMDELGMEDSLYIKMNARGRMLTPFESFKAQLSGRVQTLREQGDLEIELHNFELRLDTAWTDLFWKRYRDNFDLTFKSFFDVIFINYAGGKTLFPVKPEDVTPQMVVAAYYTLEYCGTPRAASPTIHAGPTIIFNCLGGNVSFRQRVLFFAVTEFLSAAKGEFAETSLHSWLRIWSNLANNTLDDQMRLENLPGMLESVHSLVPFWADLAEHFASPEPLKTLRTFSPAQIEEERLKAVLMRRSPDFARKILEAEAHPYFNGQLRSALQMAGIDYALASGGADQQLHELFAKFEQYWAALTSLFADTAPKDGVLLRQVLLCCGDYLIKNSTMHTFCVDNPNEAASLKALFADKERQEITQNLLDCLLQDNTLEDIKEHMQIPENDYRYCFVNHPELFKSMSAQYMRLGKWDKNYLIIKNASASCGKIEVFSYTLHLKLKESGKDSEYPIRYDIHWYDDVFVYTPQYAIRYNKKESRFEVCDRSNISTEIFATQTEKPFSEILAWLSKELSKYK